MQSRSVTIALVALSVITAPTPAFANMVVPSLPGPEHYGQVIVVALVVFASTTAAILRLKSLARELRDTQGETTRC